MANVFTSIAPVLYSAAQTVSDEACGALDAIQMSFDDKGVAKGNTVYVPYAPVAALADFTPAATTPAGTDKTAASIAVTISAAKQTSWNMTAEQIRACENGDTDKEWLRQMVMQGMRSLRNQAESDLCTAIKEGASFAIGTAGTAPFAAGYSTTASGLENLVSLRKALRDDGMPFLDAQLVMDTTASQGLLNLGVIQNYYQAGDNVQLKTGILANKFGFQMRESAGVAIHTIGAGTGYDVTSAGVAVGGTTIPLEGGTLNTTGILAGDVVTFSGGTSDTRKYVVNTGLVATSGDIVIGRPGVKVLKVTADEMTIGNAYTANVAFERSAVVGIIRPPLMVPNPTISTTLISDSHGMTYLLADCAQWGQRSWILMQCWGFKVVQNEHVAILMG